MNVWALFLAATVGDVVPGQHELGDNSAKA